MKPLPTICTWSPEAIGLTAGLTPVGFISGTYPTANLALYIPFRLQEPISITKLFSVNGAVVSGNIDVGIYSVDGTRLVSSGSTAQAGTDVCQAFDIADTLLVPGDFYLAVAMNNATGTLFRGAPAAPGAQLLRLAGVFRQTSAFPLPATASFATPTVSYTPAIGLLWGRTIL